MEESETTAPNNKDFNLHNNNNISLLFVLHIQRTITALIHEFNRKQKPCGLLIEHENKIDFIVSILFFRIPMAKYQFR